MSHYPNTFKPLLLAVLIALLNPVEVSSREAPVVLVTGSRSDNVIHVDLASGAWEELYRFEERAGPRGLARGEDGAIYVALHRSTQNVVKLTASPAGPYERTSLTRSIGRFGPGSLFLDDNGLWVAGDTERSVLLFDEQTGEELLAVRGNRTNILGIVVAGDSIYTTEFFQRSLTHFDFSVFPPVVTRHAGRSEQMNRPSGITVGPSGNLVVASRATPVLAEYDVLTGAFLGELENLADEGVTGYRDIVYDPLTRTYVAGAGKTIHLFDASGRRIASHEVPVLDGASGIAIVPTAGPAELAGEPEAPSLSSAHPESAKGSSSQASLAGVTDLLRYALGVPPGVSVADYLPKGGTLEVEGQQFLTLTFTRPDAVEDVAYVVEATGNLSEWTELAVLVSALPHADGTTTYLYRDVRPIEQEVQRFLRLRLDILTSDDLDISMAPAR
jgi:hypothetical protein